MTIKNLGLLHHMEGLLRHKAKDIDVEVGGSVTGNLQDSLDLLTSGNVPIYGQLANSLRLSRGLTEGEVKYLKGFTTAGDGGEGEFQWRTGTATDDGGTILNARGYGISQAGYWQRIYSGVLDVRWFGAIGDNSTDNTTAIKRAILAAQNIDNHTIFFPGGTYLHDGYAFADCFSGLRIHGSGIHSTTIKSANNAISIALASNGLLYDVEIAFLSINSTGGKGISVTGGNTYSGPTGFRFHDLDIVSSDDAFYTEFGPWSSNISDVYTNSTTGNGFNLGGGNSLVLTRCYAQDAASTSAGYTIRGGQVTMISCNGVNSGRWGVFGTAIADGDAANSYAYVTCIGCNVENFSTPGIHVKTGSTISIYGGTFLAPAAGSNWVAILSSYSPIPGVIDAATKIDTQGATWSHGEPIHVGNNTQAPFFVYGTPDSVSRWSTYWHDTAGLQGHLPSVAAGHDGSYFHTWKFSRITLDGPITLKQHTVTYSAGMVPDPTLGTTQVITVTDGNAFAISYPYYPAQGMRMRFDIKNASGGAMGIATWNGAYKMATWTNPSNGYRISIEFEYDGTNWIEIFRSAEVPN